MKNLPWPFATDGRRVQLQNTPMRQPLPSVPKEQQAQKSQFCEYHLGCVGRNQRINFLLPLSQLDFGRPRKHIRNTTYLHTQAFSNTMAAVEQSASGTFQWFCSQLLAARPCQCP